jgi:hypothetical protein
MRKQVCPRKAMPCSTPLTTFSLTHLGMYMFPTRITTGPEINHSVKKQKNG